MWGCNGRLGKIGIEWDLSKSNEVVAKAATGLVGVGLAAGWSECNLWASVVECLCFDQTLLSSP